LDGDLTLAWNNPNVSVETRKRIIRLLICEIIVDVTGDNRRCMGGLKEVSRSEAIRRLIEIGLKAKK